MCEKETMLATGNADALAVLTTSDLCGGDDVFFAATGVSDGNLLKGVRFTKDGAVSHSLVMRSPSGTVREMTTHHRWSQ